MKPAFTDPITKERYSLFSADYEHAGSHWGLEIWAKDQADADAKLRAIRTTATHCVEIHGQITAPRRLAWLVEPYLTFRCWLANLFT